MAFSLPFPPSHAIVQSLYQSRVTRKQFCIFLIILHITKNVSLSGVVLTITVNLVVEILLEKTSSTFLLDMT